MRSKVITAALATGAMLLTLPAYAADARPGNANPAKATAQPGSAAGQFAVLLPVLTGLGQGSQAAAQPSPGPGQSPGAPTAVRGLLAQLQARVTAILQAVSDRVGLPFSP